MFPIGSLTKDVVKKIAKSKEGLDKFANKKESMGICFVGKRKTGNRETGFQGLLKEYTESVPGPMVDIDSNNKVVGGHQGVHLWTIGQGTKIPSHPNRTYVCDKDKKTNTLYVCQGENHPALFSENFHTDEPYWIDQAPEELSDRSKDQVCNFQIFRLIYLHSECFDKERCYFTSTEGFLNF